MTIQEMIDYLLQFPPTVTVRLWNWFPLAGSGTEYDLHFTANKGGDIIRMSAEGGRDWNTGPQRKRYLRVEDSGQFDIVGDTWMTSEEAATANYWVNYYGDVFVRASEYEDWTARKGDRRVLPDEYREEEEED